MILVVLQIVHLHWPTQHRERAGRWHPMTVRNMLLR
jgi:hypothetical protein